ncbi:coiled-coil domain-containing protein 42 homolog [Trichomycterus rosablanca]|uniref:coiled-coil domain-containing protein 42 homolog n=1 Tax=Trichomycterus rosablanca TaxID=2290929 RepID=UPI002F35651C
MSVNLEDYFHTVFEEQLSARFSVHEDDDLRSGAMRLLDKHRELQQMDATLQTQRQEFEVKKESLRQKREELKTQEENLKDSLLKFDRFLKENDGKRARGLKKAETERAAVKDREQELQQLHTNIAALLEQKERLQASAHRYEIYRHFLHNVLTTAKKFEDVGQLTGRFETLISTREHLLKRQSKAEGQKENEDAELRRYVSERRSKLLQHGNTVSKLRTELDCVLSQGLELESAWDHIQATAAKSTLLLGQIKVVTLNLYHMTDGGAGGEEGVDTHEQLNRIQRFIQDQADVIHYLRSDSAGGSIRHTNGE